VNCWSYYNNQPACENTSDALACLWNNPYCEMISCWYWDGTNATACENDSLNNHGLFCTYSNNFCDQTGGGCSDFDNKSKECLDTSWCKWDFNTGSCNEPSTADQTDEEEKQKASNPICRIFDLNETVCNSTTICAYNSSASQCQNTANYTTVNVQCENITDMSVCNSIPAMSTCCKWRSSTNCTTDQQGTGCWDNMEEPKEGGAFCEDWLAYEDKATCDDIANYPYWMPCRWDGENCGFTTAIFGLGDDLKFSEVKTKKACEGIGGNWICEQFCNLNATPADTTDDFLDSDCWCEQGKGISNAICAKQCWVCEVQNNGSAWNDSTAAQAACEASSANCAFTADANATNGFGYCKAGTATKRKGTCDSKCSNCNDLVDDLTTARNEKKLACLKSKATCQWAANLANKSQGTCVKDSDKICSEDCFKCTNEECDDYGLGESGKCAWDSEDKLCKPMNFDNLKTEMCSNGKDDDNDGAVDCEDPDCFFSGDCTEGGMIQDCYIYNNNESMCNSSLDSLGNNCTWTQDPFGGEWCGHPSEKCWQFDNSPEQCNLQNGACQYTTQGGMCDVNKTKAEVCFGKVQASCSGDCKWISDPGSKKGGRCEFKMFATCGDPDITTKASCEDTLLGRDKLCKWNDMMSHCEPRCFMLDNNNTCLNNKNCLWRSGWCEPNITMGDDCFKYDNNEGLCGAQSACAWHSASFGGCDLNWSSSVYINIHCEDQYFDQTLCNADGNCTWVSDPHSGKGGFCSNKVFECWQMNQSVCGNLYGCEWHNGWQECIPTCEYNSSVLNQTCGDIPGCAAMSGWCNPLGMHEMMKNFDAPPMPIGNDSCTETSKQGWVDVCFMGVKDMPDGMALAMPVRNFTMAATCKDETIVLNPEDPNSDVITGSGTTPVKYGWYLDTDGNADNNCNSTRNLKQGFEYNIVLESTIADTKTLTVYKCSGGEWVEGSDIVVSTDKKLMCSKAGGPVVVLDRETFLGQDDIDLDADMRVYGVSLNATTKAERILDSIEGVYTPGAFDKKFEDCFCPKCDMDGDGLKAESDPDCDEFFKTGKLFNKEKCSDNVDNNDDLLVDCDDPQCWEKPHCAGSVTMVNDTTSAEVSSYSVKEFVDEAIITYYSSEMANGSAWFYGTDSSCAALNRTISDPGATYKMWHEASVRNLANGTTYFFKLKACDEAGNPCGWSACRNFTTYGTLSACGVNCESVLVIKVEDANVGVKWNFSGEVIDTTLVCGGESEGIRKKYNETENTDVELENSAGGFSITFNNVTAKGTMDTNKSTIKQDDIIHNTTSSGIEYIGMDEDKGDDIEGELKPESMTLCVPGNVDELYYCPTEAAAEAGTCTLMTSSQILSGPTYDSTLECTKFEVTTGFSVYYGDSGGDDSGDDSGGDSGGGGGGGSGGVLPQEILELGYLDAGDSVSVSFTKSDEHYFRKISLKAVNEITNGMVKVILYEDKPFVLTEPEKDVFNYFHLEAVNFDGTTDISDVTLRFKISKTWFTDNNLDPQKVTFLRDVDGAWVELETEKETSIGSYYYYAAETPGFSYFAAVADEKVAGAVAPGVEEEAAPEEKEGIPILEKLIPEGAPSWLVYLIAAGVVVAIVWLFFGGLKKRGAI